MRRLLREIASTGQITGDVTTLEDFTALEKLRAEEEE
jgi:acetyl-CoA synthetase